MKQTLLENPWSGVLPAEELFLNLQLPHFTYKDTEFLGDGCYRMVK
jgi:hypothetical protein